jgi:hypothetical protein
MVLCGCLSTLAQVAKMLVAAVTLKNKLIILCHLVLRVLIRIRHDSVNDVLVEPWPSFLCSCKPEEYGNDNDEGEDRKGVVEVVPSNWKILGKAEDHHHPSGVRQSKDIDRDAVCSKRTTARSYAVHQSST